MINAQLHAKGPPALQTLEYLVLVRSRVEGSRLGIWLLLGSDHRLALIRFVRVSSMSGPPCVRDEDDRSLSGKAGTVEGSRRGKRHVPGRSRARER